MMTKAGKSSPRGFITFDMLAGIFLLVAMASVLAASTGLRARNAQHLADQRAAMAVAQRTLSEGNPPAGSSARITVDHTGKRISDREWINVSVILNGRHASLSGLAPAGGTK